MIKDSADANCRMLLDVLSARGVDTAVVSPGSRNTPLLIALSARDNIKKIVIADERTAAFTALGIAMVKRTPVMLVCTSGTALYNYAPAVAEAYYQHLPLIVISADRPEQWIDQDDSQTLRQYEALHNIVKKSYDISPDTGYRTPCTNHAFESEMSWFTNRIANDAATTAMYGTPGPVHINIQLSTPLNKEVEYIPNNPRIIKYVSAEGGLSRKQIAEIAEILSNKRILLVAGFLPPDHKLNRAVKMFSSLPNVAVMAETLSNLHCGKHCNMIDSLLKNLDTTTRELLKPDVIISIGGALVSRMAKEFLRGCDNAIHITLGDTDSATDCFQRLTYHYNARPAQFLSAVSSGIKRINHKPTDDKEIREYSNLWMQAREEAHNGNESALKEIPWSELKAHQCIFSSIPSEFNLIVSNGTSVRYAQLFTENGTHACYGARGVSGIDGTNAIALGAAMAYRGGSTLLITGDMSFGYCPEVLHEAIQKRANLHIILFNNKGGGIFRFISSTRDLDIREKYFCADSSLPIRKITEAYGWHYLHADSYDTLTAQLEAFFSSPRSLLEISVDPEQSADVLKKYMLYRY